MRAFITTITMKAKSMLTAEKMAGSARMNAARAATAKAIDMANARSEELVAALEKETRDNEQLRRALEVEKEEGLARLASVQADATSEKQRLLSVMRAEKDAAIASAEAHALAEQQFVEQQLNEALATNDHDMMEMRHRHTQGTKCNCNAASWIFAVSRQLQSGTNVGR